MKDAEKTLIQLSAAALHDTDACRWDEKQCDTDSLYAAAAKQGMIGQVYPMVEKTVKSEGWGERMLDPWRAAVQHQFFKRVIYARQVKFLAQSLNMAGVEFILVKGMAIARYLPVPEYRGMSDVDLLIAEQDMSTARSVIEEIGYEMLPSDHPMHLEFMKPGFTRIELHHSLIHDGFFQNRPADAWHEHIWQHRQMITAEGITFHALSVEDELVNQVVHFASHMVYTGARLKNLFDLALLTRCGSTSIDWGYVERTLEMLGFMEFGRLLFALCGAVYGITVPERLTTVTRVIPEVFLDNFMNQYSLECLSNDWKAWAYVSCDHPAMIRYPALQVLAWPMVAWFQWKADRPEVAKTMRNTMKNIRRFQRKAEFVRRIGLL